MRDYNSVILSMEGQDSRRRFVGWECEFGDLTVASITAVENSAGDQEVRLILTDQKKERFVWSMRDRVLRHQDKGRAVVHPHWDFQQDWRFKLGTVRHRKQRAA